MPKHSARYHKQYAVHVHMHVLLVHFEKFWSTTRYFSQIHNGIEWNEEHILSTGIVIVYLTKNFHSSKNGTQDTDVSKVKSRVLSLSPRTGVGLEYTIQLWMNSRTGRYPLRTTQDFGSTTGAIKWALFWQEWKYTLYINGHVTMIGSFSISRS